MPFEQNPPNSSLPGTTAPPPMMHRDIFPRGAYGMTGAQFGFFLTVAVCVCGFPIARALARWIERWSAPGRGPEASVAPQLQQLQESVDALAIELERLAEGQRFSAALLAQRASAPRGIE